MPWCSRLTLTLLLLSPRAFAQAADWTPESVPGTATEVTPSPTDVESDYSPDELDQERLQNNRADPELKFDDEHRDAELGLSQAEIRGAQSYGIAAVLGPSNPWMTLGIEGYHPLDGTKALSLAFGRGAFSINGRKGQIDYDVDSATTSTLLGFRYHLSDTVPMFITPMLGYASWNGRLDPSGTDDPASLSELELLKTGFSVRGIVVGASVGLSYNWENGWFIEYVLINYSQAIPISSDFTSDSSLAHKEVNRALTRPGSWGLLNLKVGYFF